MISLPYPRANSTSDVPAREELGRVLSVETNSDGSLEMKDWKKTSIISNFKRGTSDKYVTTVKVNHLFPGGIVGADVTFYYRETSTVG